MAKEQSKEFVPLTLEQIQARIGELSSSARKPWSSTIWLKVRPRIPLPFEVIIAEKKVSLEPTGEVDELWGLQKLAFQFTSKEPKVYDQHEKGKEVDMTQYVVRDSYKRKRLSDEISELTGEETTKIHELIRLVIQRRKTNEEVSIREAEEIMQSKARANAELELNQRMQKEQQES